jgi:hypothetical protein
MHTFRDLIKKIIFVCAARDNKSENTQKQPLLLCSAANLFYFDETDSFDSFITAHSVKPLVSSNTELRLVRCI